MTRLSTEPDPPPLHTHTSRSPATSWLPLEHTDKPGIPSVVQSHHVVLSPRGCGRLPGCPASPAVCENPILCMRRTVPSPARWSHRQFPLGDSVWTGTLAQPKAAQDYPAQNPRRHSATTGKFWCRSRPRQTSRTKVGVAEDSRQKVVPPNPLQ